MIRADVNMFIPNTVIVKEGSILRWSNPSNLPHNVVGVFNQTTGLGAAAKSSGLIHKNSTGNNNSGFIQPTNSWQYHFSKAGVFNYLCTIHSEEGMRGTIIVVPS